MGIALTLLWLFFGIIGPFYALFLTSIQNTPWFLSYFDLLNPVYALLFLRSFALAFFTSIICICLALVVVYRMIWLNNKQQQLVLCLVLIPFWTNFLIRILSIMEILRPLELLYSPGGILIAMVYNYLPMAILPLYGSMKNLDLRIFEAAQDLGAQRFFYLKSTVIPLSWPGIQNAMIFTFIPALGEFLIPELVGGGRIFFLGSFLQNQFFSARNWPLGSAAVICFLIITFFCFYLIRKRKS